jgi:streptogramin lyase
MKFRLAISCLATTLRRGGLSRLRLTAASALTVCVLTGVPLEAQTAHFSGAVVTLGSGFSTPTGVAVDASGNVYVADFGNSAVKEIVAVNGKIPPLPVINTLGSGFSNPFTVAVDGSGNVYVADYGNHAVKEIEAVNGSIPPSPTIRTLASGLSFIFGSAVDGKGDVFFSEYGKNEVKEIVAVNGVIPASPKIITLGGGFNIPAGVAVDGNGNVFVGDQNNNAAKEILAAGGYTTVLTLATGFNTPDGIAVDGNGNVYVANDGGNAVDEIVEVNGSIPVTPSIINLGAGFLQPFDVAVDGMGNIYVADRGNNAVKEIQIAAGRFGPVNVGTTTLSPEAFSFTFDTAATLGSTAVLTQGNAGQDFYDAGGGTCVANTAYAAGSSCTVNVKFNPLAPGPRYGAVELLNVSGSLLASVYLQGTGVGPQATFADTTSGASIPSQEFHLGSGFSGPGGVAVDGSENVFVADSANNAVKEIRATGGWTTVNTLGSGFNFPSSVALDGGGNVFVADTFNDAVKEIVAAGGYSTIISLGSGFSDPYGVAVDKFGNVFVADFANNAVKEMIAVNGSIPASPTIRTLASGLDFPDGVAVDGNGDVFVANYGDSTVQEIVAVNGSIPTSPTIKTIGSGFSSPSNLSVDAAGNVFVSDTGNSVVKEIVSAGGYTTVKILGSGFNSPEAVAVNGIGDVIVADTGNSAIDLLDYADTPSLTFASTSVGSTSSDSPRTVVMQNDGNQPLKLSGLSYPADFPEDFAAGGTETLCTGTSSLNAGQLCYLPVNFTPLQVATLHESLTITDNTLNLSGAKQIIALSGTGVAPQVSRSPAKLAFGTVATNKTLAVTVKNLGTTALTFGGPTITGAGMAKFSVLPYQASPATSTCLNPALTSLAQNATCTYSVEFNNAGATTSAAASLNIFDNAAGSPQVEPLTGTGTEVSRSPATLAFGTVATSKTLALTVKNLGTTPLTFSSPPTVTGTGAANFAVLPYSAPSTSTCLNPSLTSLAQNATCTYSVKFTNAGGTTSFTTNLNIFDNGGGSPQLETMTATD